MMFYWRFCLKTNSPLIYPMFPFSLSLSLSLLHTGFLFSLFIYYYYFYVPVARYPHSRIYLLLCLKTVRPFVRRPDEPMGKATMGGGGRTSAWFGTRCMRAFVPVAKLPSAWDKLLVESFRRKNNDFNGKTTRRMTTADFVRSLIILQAALKYRKN